MELDLQVGLCVTVLCPPLAVYSAPPSSLRDGTIVWHFAAGAVLGIVIALGLIVAARPRHDLPLWFIHRSGPPQRRRTPKTWRSLGGLLAGALVFSVLVGSRYDPRWQFFWVVSVLGLAVLVSTAHYRWRLGREPQPEAGVHPGGPNT